MRWLRRIGFGLVLLAIGVTSCSAGLVAATDRPGVPFRAASAGPFVLTDGVWTRYERWGASGSPIVLVHGFVESTAAWRPVAELLARDHVVYALDLRGFGLGERKGPYDLDGWTRQVQAFLAALRIVRPVLVGHSLGAAVVAEVARRAPASVAGIVLADGDGRKTGGGPPPLVRSLMPGPVFTAIVRIATRSDVVADQALQRTWGPNPPRFDHAAIAPWLAPFRVVGAEAALRDMASRPIAGLDDAVLATVRVRALVLWGAHDDAVPLSDGRIAARLLRAPLVVLPAAGHVSQLSDPGGFATAVDRFAAA
jgi:pimeloyl-ACP methyl ester carboxylesterase